MIEPKEDDFFRVEQFPLFWRWSEENYTIFTPDEIALVRPLNPIFSQKLHNKLLSAYSDTNLNRKLFDSVREIQTNDNNECDVQHWLENLPIKKDGVVFLSWDQDTSIITTVELFIRKWSDFWYPSSDDLTVTNMSMSWVIGISHDGHIIWGKTNG